MNVDLLESVRQVIVQFPDRFSAAQWAFARNADRVLSVGAEPEGFRCCIAGHVLLQQGTHGERALLEMGGFHTGGEVWVRAADALDLNQHRCRELFFPSQWDTPYKQNYYLCTSSEEAKVAAAYLDYFMQKYGADRPIPQPEKAPAPEAISSSLVPVPA